MPHWNEPQLDDELAWTARDIAAAEKLRDTLLLGSRDRQRVEEVIARLNTRVRDLRENPGQILEFPDGSAGSVKPDEARARDA